MPYTIPVNGETPDGWTLDVFNGASEGVSHVMYYNLDAGFTRTCNECGLYIYPATFFGFDLYPPCYTGEQ